MRTNITQAAIEQIARKVVNAHNDWMDATNTQHDRDYACGCEHGIIFAFASLTGQSIAAAHAMLMKRGTAIK